MKKFLLLSLGIFIAFGLSAQKINPKSQAKFTTTHDKVVANSFEFTKVFSPVVQNKASLAEDIIAGETRYDLQTNSAVQNRIWIYDDGTIGATWTMGFEEGASYPGRGTGYNYNNGAGPEDWGPLPEDRIQSVRCGWPSYAPFGTNGEITCAHSADARIIFNWRENKGEGDWNEFAFEGPEGGPGLLWPRMITSGANHDTIHLIALTMPTGNGGTPWQGQDGALLYSRSTDGGTTWDIENYLFPDLDASVYAAMSGDDYAWASPKAGTIAFTYFDGWSDGVIMKSEDGGDSWDKITYFEFPWGGTPPDVVDQFFGAGDGNTAIALDNSGKAHIAFGRYPVKLAEGNFYTRYYYPNGLLYWNEDLDPLDTATVAGGFAYYLPEELEESEYFLAKVKDPFDSLASEYPADYANSLSSMPQILIDDNNQILVTYSALTAGYENNGLNYRHLWGIFSPDGGVTWDTNTNMDYMADLFHLFSECSFPSVAPVVYNGHAHLVYQTSNLPGIAVRYEVHEVVDNNIVYLPIPWIYTDIEETEINSISYVSQNYPNPFKNQTTVQVNTLDRSDLSLVVTNLVGKKVLEIDKGQVDAGVHYFNIQANNLPKGMYLYTVYSGKNSETKKMIVE